MCMFNLAVRLGLKRLSGVVWVSQRFGLAYPKAELEDLGFSGLQVVPTTIQPLQDQPVRRMIATICLLIKCKEGIWGLQTQNKKTVP